MNLHPIETVYKTEDN